MANLEIIKALNDNRLMPTEAEVAAFESALRLLVESHEEHDLNLLFAIFTDRCTHQEVMWGLLHYIETYPMMTFLESLIQSQPMMLDDAREWCAIINFRILNHDAYRPAYRELYHRATLEQRRTVETILASVRSDDTDLNMLIDEILVR